MPHERADGTGGVKASKSPEKGLGRVTGGTFARLAKE
jgi:hypothetical protein